MNRQDYYSLMEDIGVKQATLQKVDWIRQILEVYPMYKNMTLFEVKELLTDKAADMGIRIERELGVK